MAEKDLPGQEMRSEALLQRFILSHPATLPVTPRIQRGSRGRMFSFSRTNSDSSRSSSVGNSSDDDGPFAVDEALESDDGRGRAVGGPSGWDSSKMEVEMMHLGGGGGEGSVTSISDAGSGMAVDGPPSVRKTPYGRPSMSGLNGFGHMAVDEMGGGNGGLSGSPRGDVSVPKLHTLPRHLATHAERYRLQQHIAPSMLWRESPSNHGRPNKRKGEQLLTIRPGHSRSSLQTWQPSLRIRDSSRTPSGCDRWAIPQAQAAQDTSSVITPRCTCMHQHRQA
jgi:hypothetical protein